MTTIVFRWTMLGLEKETLLRGVLPAPLNEDFSSRRRILGANTGWSTVLPSLLFGAVHAFAYTDGKVSLALGAVLWTFALTLLLVWVRERIAGLLVPVLCHSALGGLRTMF
jgi:membrane protease YdiL (CAAX protease family)